MGSILINNNPSGSTSTSLIVSEVGVVYETGKEQLYAKNSAGDTVILASTRNGLTIEKQTTELAANVREQYNFKNLAGELIQSIPIYKDSSIISISYDKTTQKLTYAYIDVNGVTQTTVVDLQDLIIENEIGNGLQVNDHVISVKKDTTSESFLSVSSNGVKISGVQSAINTASGNVTTAWTTAVNNEKTAREAADNTLTTNLNKEISDRTTADTALGGRIDTETSERKTADTALGKRIDDEASARSTADTTLTTNLNKEISDRKSDVSTLTTSISNEASARDTEDKRLNNLITAETANRQSEDTKLNNSITAETAARQSADSTLDGKISTEATTRGNADTALSNRIKSLEDATPSGATSTNPIIVKSDIKSLSINFGSATGQTNKTYSPLTAGTSFTIPTSLSHITSAHTHAISDVTGYSNSDLKFQSGTFSAVVTYNPSGATKTINIPTAPSHVGAAASNHNHDTVYMKKTDVATATALGGIQIGYETNGKNYAVQLSSNKAYVNVPWANTTYSAGNFLSLSSTTFSAKTGTTADTLAVGNHNHNTVYMGIGTKASSDTLGGIKVGYTTDTTNKNYKVQVDTNGNAFVNVPWTDTNTNTTYSAGNFITINSSNQISVSTGTSNTTVAVGNHTHSNYMTTGTVASADTLGGIKIGYTASGKNYPVALDSSNKAYVNVPWTDNNTTYSAGNFLTLSNGTFTVSTGTTSTTVAVGNHNHDGVYLKTVPSATTTTFGGIKTNYTTSGKNYKVQLDTNGNAFVNVPWDDTNTTYTATGFLSLSGTVFNAKTGNTADTLAVGNHTHSQYLTSVPLATSAATGGIQIGYSTNGKNYAVQLSNNKAYVNVPWTDTTYTLTKAAVEGVLTGNISSHTHSAYVTTTVFDNSRQVIYTSVTANYTMPTIAPSANGYETHYIINNSGSSEISVVLPSGSGFVLTNDENAMKIAAGKYGEVNYLKVGSTTFVRYA